MYKIVENIQFLPFNLEDFIYKKKSIGQGGIEINAYKITTMCKAADQLMPNFLCQGQDKVADDPRILPKRKWLRKTGLDELPQIFNIIKGEMTLFGPRPLSLKRFENLTPKQKNERNRVKPGIFGSYAFKSKRRKERTLIELEDIYLHLRLRKERKGKSLVFFNAWILVNAILALLRGANK